MGQSSLAESLKNAIQNEEGSISLETNTPYTDQIIIEESVQKITSKLHENLTSRSLDIAFHIFNAWKEKENKENLWRRVIAIVTFGILILQLYVLAQFVFEIGRGTMNFEGRIIELYVTGVFAEIVGIIILITKYMYSERSLRPLEIVQNILENVGKNNSDFNDHE